MLRAFSSGAVALTGVETITNSVPYFRKPRAANAAATLGVLGAISAALLAGVLYLADRTDVVVVGDPEEQLLVDGRQAHAAHGVAVLVPDDGAVVPDLDVVEPQPLHRPRTLPPSLSRQSRAAEARAWGADCILIILAAVGDDVARYLLDAAEEWKMDALVEVHDQLELDRALALDAKFIGINNRNLRTFDVDLAGAQTVGDVIDRFNAAATGGAVTAHVQEAVPVLFSASVAVTVCGEVSITERHGHR